jgi:uncharacterized protein YbbK (DUF523 family)
MDFTMKLVAACLCGINCRYNGTSKLNSEILEMVARGEAIPICPELMAGLSTPREACERVGNKILSATGRDYTEDFNKGANEALKFAQAVGANEFIGKNGSPSCGVGMQYDGTFSNKQIPGDGVVTELLKNNDIKVSSI